MRYRFPSWLVGAVAGIALGVGFYTFVYAHGASYLVNDPAACANCHIMNDQYDSWLKSSHHAIATCNDCHTPHGLVPKYFTKALNGFNHSVAFTTGWFHEPIRPTERNRRITEQACRGCHEEMVSAIDSHGERPGDELRCSQCHLNAGHLHLD